MKGERRPGIAGFIFMAEFNPQHAFSIFSTNHSWRRRQHVGRKYSQCNALSHLRRHHNMNFTWHSYV